MAPIDLGGPFEEHVITLLEASKQLPTHPSAATLKRWITHGCRGTYLVGSKVGGRWVTSEAAITEFVRGTTTKAMPRRERSPAQRSRAAEQAVEWLKREGVIRGRFGKAARPGAKP